jgi:polyvinyl alcohol dehydrogenase (cytochrome)
MNLFELVAKKDGHVGINIAWGRRWVLGVMLATLVAAPMMAQDWPMFGTDTTNTATNNSSISTANVGQLETKWTFTTGGDVSARAAVVSGVAYFPDWGGNVWAVNDRNGQEIWGHQLSDYGLPAGTVSRTTPAVKGNTLYIGTQRGAWLLAINANTGNLKWMTQLETADPYAIISASPVVQGDVVYTGVASQAEGATYAGVNLATAVARGSVVAVGADKGVIQWKTYTVPVGYLGGGVWGSSPVVDTSRNTVFVGTGDNYAHPQSSAPSSNPNLTYGACLSAVGGTEAGCLAPNDYVDSILALDMSTGAVKWGSQMVNWNQPYEPVNGFDDWNVDCIYGLPQCPTNPGPDYDFGSGPNEITYKPAKGRRVTIIGAGQKSGIYYALDPDTGATLWQTQVGPGSSLGGMEWGSASDGTNIYVAISNYYSISYAAGSAGSWAALNPATGAIVWQTADPNVAVDIGPMAVANGVVYGSSLSTKPTASNMVAMNASTGAILWSFAPGVSVNAGATIVKGTVYWGSGYSNLGLGTGGNKTFYAFSVNGN